MPSLSAIPLRLALLPAAVVVAGVAVAGSSPSHAGHPAAAPAVAVQKAAPAAVAYTTRSVTCDVGVAGGIARASAIVSYSGPYATVTEKITNRSVPRAIGVMRNAIVAENDTFHLYGGTLGMGESTNTSATYNVWRPNAVLVVAVVDTRGNYGWNACGLD